MADPKYVRLSNRLARGLVVDIDSGWSLSGLDVKEFPDDRHQLAQSYVRDALRSGKLEGCSRAEYDEVQETKVPFEPEDPDLVQEAHLIGYHDANREKLEASRDLGADQDYDDDEVRRLRTIERQNRLDDGEDPEDLDAEEAEEAAAEEEGEDDAEKPPAAAKKAAAPAKKTASARGKATS